MLVPLIQPLLNPYAKLTKQLIDTILSLFANP